MAMGHHERVGRALTLVRDGVKPGLAQAWETFYGKDWLAKVNGQGHPPVENPSADDLAFLLAGMWNTWGAVFARQFGPAERNCVLELREELKRWRRSEVFSADDARLVLETCEQLLTAFSADAQVTGVRAIRFDTSPAAITPTSPSSPSLPPGPSVPTPPKPAPPAAVQPGGAQSARTKRPDKPAPPSRPGSQPPKQAPPAAVQPGGAQSARTKRPDKPPPSARRSPRTTGARLAPYVAWAASRLPDPREAGRTILARSIRSIVEAEGPVAADRVYSLIVEAAGLSRVTQVVRRPLNRAVFSVRDLSIREFRNPLTKWPQRVLRVKGTDETNIRELGPRTLYEVPLDEIAALIDRLAPRRPWRDPEQIKRRVLESYGLRRLTAKAEQYLDAAIALRPP